MRKDYTEGSDHPVTNEHEWLIREFHNETDHAGYWDVCPQPRCKRARAGLLDSRLSLFEAGMSVPGTCLQRVLCDVSILKREGVTLPEGSAGKSMICWSLSLGQLFEPKKFIYGLTPEECFVKALKWMKER